MKGLTEVLCEAAACGDLAQAEAALEAGARVNAPGPAHLKALDHAVANGQVEMVRHLLNRGATLTSTTLSVANMSAYSSPWLLKYLQLAQLKQARPKTKSKARQDARLLSAAYAGDVGALKKAIEAGADVNASDEQDNSAIRWAARAGHADVVRVLLDAGADVEGKSRTGWTALLEAVLGGHEEVVALLVERGANVDASIFTGASILYLANDAVQFSDEPERAQRIVALLESRGAKCVEPEEDDED